MLYNKGEKSLKILLKKYKLWKNFIKDIYLLMISLKNYAKIFKCYLNSLNIHKKKQVKLFLRLEVLIHVNFLFYI